MSKFTFYTDFKVCSVLYSWFFRGELKTFEFNKRRYIVDGFGIHGLHDYNWSTGWTLLQQCGTFRDCKIVPKIIGNK